MKKTLKIIFIVLLLGYGAFFMLNKLGASKVYTNTSMANEPNLKLNAKMIVSNIGTPKIGDFIVYNTGDTLVRVHRLCAMENDMLKIVNGVVYVNGKKIDEKIPLMHTYLLPKESYMSMRQSGDTNDTSPTFAVDSVTIQTLLQDKIAAKYGVLSKRKIDNQEYADPAISRMFGHNWNKDNFGPLRIPKNKMFVIGDNRDDSEDSRYFGFVDKSILLGTVVLK